MLSLYQRSFSCKGIVFSDSRAVKDFAAENNVATVSNVVRNRYGLPIASSIFQRARDSVNGSFYGYINSDVILNPHVVSLLPYVRKLIKQRRLSPILVLGSRVRMIKTSFNTVDFSSIDRFKKALNSIREGVLRNVNSAVWSVMWLFIRMFSFLQPPFHLKEYLQLW